jgi:hypothetical protein
LDETESEASVSTYNEKVKSTIESGAVDRHTFDGEFNKTDSSVFSVGRTTLQK